MYISSKQIQLYHPNFHRANLFNPSYDSVKNLKTDDNHAHSPYNGFDKNY